MRQRLVSFSIAAVLSPLKGISAFPNGNAPTLSFAFTSSPSKSASIVLLSGTVLRHHSTTAVSCSSSQTKMNLSSVDTSEDVLVDEEYPGTAVLRLRNVRERVAQLSEDDLNGNWEDVRRKILWAGGLKDLPTAIPGQGYTGHSFQDYNHVDLTTMNDEVSHNENGGEVKGIAIGNRLGDGIRIASLPELGPGGSWSTCANGCHLEPPQDVAHIQFRSRIAFKLVWAPNKEFNTFVLVDDDGKELARGCPAGKLPPLQYRQMNYRLVAGSKYATVVDKIASE